MALPSLLRAAEHRALARVRLSGRVLDLGGDVRADYRSLIQGDPQFTTVNMDTKTRPDIMHDLEEPLPITAASYDHVLLINVLEHVFNHGGLLSEAARVVKPGGTVLIIVPFLFPLHPSPRDFWRFSSEALQRLCTDADLTVSEVTPLGSGVFSARFLMFDRLMPFPIRLVLCVVRPLVLFMDYLFTNIAHLLGKKYDPADYALGFSVIARR